MNKRWGPGNKESTQEIGEENYPIAMVMESPQDGSCD